MVGWTDLRQAPSAARYLRLIAPAAAGDDVDTPHESDIGLPYPFFLAHPLQADPATLGSTADWIAKWKWDGIRAQVVRRTGRVWIWSRGEDLVMDRFPELASLGAALPDGTVIDGEILAWEPGAAAPLPFARLQPRITRKSLTKKVLADSPAALLAYDLLEADGRDLRTEPLHARRARLDALAHELSSTLAVDLLRVYPMVIASDWGALAALREESRARRRRTDAQGARAMYGVGRTKASGTWWKWKIDPYSIDAVLLYAQPGHGRRASLYTDFTFAVWDETDGFVYARPVCQGLLGSDRRRDAPGRRHRAQDDHREVRTGEKRHADARL